MWTGVTRTPFVNHVNTLPLWRVASLSRGRREIGGMEADSSEQVQVSATEIARLARVGRAAVSNWRRRYATFPEPSGGTTTSPSFDLHDVEHWLRSNGKLDDIDQADRLWLAVNPGPSPEA